MGEVFSISFSSGVDGQDTLQVRAADGGESDAVWQCPFPAESIDALAENAVLGLPAGSGQRILRVRHLPEPIDPERLGQLLFTSLFAGKVAEAWHRSLGRLRGRDQDLTLELSFDPESQRSRQLFSLPWELLHDGLEFLVLSRRPVVRRLRVLRPESAPGLPENQLRVLAVVLSSRDLDTHQEVANLVALEKKLPTLKVEVLREPSVEAMREELESGDFQVLHLMGHGSWDPASGAYGLETSGGFWRAGVFAEQLGAHRSQIRLVVLNACSSGRAVLGGRGAADAGLAIELVKRGFLTVIAMQAPVRDQAAILFAESLYRRLAAGQNPAAALGSARLDLRAASAEGRLGPGEFATPILLDRSKDELFRVPRPSWARRAKVFGGLAIVFLAVSVLWDVYDSAAPGRVEIHRVAKENEPFVAELKAFLQSQGFDPLVQSGPLGAGDRASEWQLGVAFTQTNPKVPVLQIEVRREGKLIRTLSEPWDDPERRTSLLLKQLELVLAEENPTAFSALGDSNSLVRQAYERALAFYLEERWNEAAAAFREAVQLDSDNPILRHNLARALEEQAMELASQPVDPDSPEAGELRAEVRRLYEDALRESKMAIEFSPPSVHYHYQHGRLLEALAYGDPAGREKAAAEYERALELRPFFPPAGNDLARLWIAGGKARQAIPLLEELRSRSLPSEQMAMILKNLGRGHQEVGDPGKALQHYDQALQHATGAPAVQLEIYFLKASVYQKSGDRASECLAWEAYNRAFSAVGADPDAERRAVFFQRGTGCPS